MGAVHYPVTSPNIYQTGWRHVSEHTEGRRMTAGEAEGRAVPVHDMTAWRSRGKTPLILNLCTR